MLLTATLNSVISKSNDATWQMFYATKPRICHCFLLQENPNPQPYAQKVPKPPEGSHTRVHQPVFPTLDRLKIIDIIEEGIAKHSLKSK